LAKSSNWNLKQLTGGCDFFDIDNLTFLSSSFKCYLTIIGTLKKNKIAVILDLVILFNYNVYMVYLSLKIIVRTKKKNKLKSEEREKTMGF
jgi:hypothetical protein